MEADHVGLAVHSVQVHVLAAQLLHGIVLEGVVADDAHAKAPEDLRRDLADLAGADDPSGLAVHVHTHQAAKLVVAVADTVPRLVEAPVQGEDHGDGMLGHGPGAVRGHPHDPDAELLRRSQVNPVEPRATQQKQLDTVLFKNFENLAVRLIVDEEARCHGSLAETGRLCPAGLLNKEGSREGINQRLHEAAHVRHSGEDGDPRRSFGARAEEAAHVHHAIGAHAEALDELLQLVRGPLPWREVLKDCGQLITVKPPFRIGLQNVEDLDA
mmetsp:Transcript_50098/g.112558  ORF Transcript_50098/g.112558 Transcript_50098/m.112558 type:complete len:270 (-) Transcript_50098:49-858(-)